MKPRISIGFRVFNEETYLDRVFNCVFRQVADEELRPNQHPVEMPAHQEA